MAIKKIDTEVIERLIKKDEQALEEVYEHYKNVLYVFILGLTKNSADSEEIMQDTFIQVYQKIDSLKTPASFQSWMYTIAYNGAMMKYRKDRNKVQLNADDVLEKTIATNEADNPDKLYEKNDFIQVVADEISKLPVKFSQVARLKYFEEFTTTEIADILDISNGTVKTRLMRIREIIQPVLNTQGYSPKSFYGVAFTPLMAKVFTQMVSKVQLSTVDSQKIYDGIVSHTQATLSIGTSSGVVAKIVGLSFGIKATAAAMLSLVVLSGVYLQTTPTELEVANVAYSNAITNKDIEVEVVLNKTAEEELICFEYGGTKLEFKQEGNTYRFLAKESGIYTIHAAKQSQVIEITNIDKETPKLNTISYVSDVLNLELEDNQSGIDYAKSYVVYNDKKIPIAKDGKVKGTIRDSIEIYIVDQAGNDAGYIYEIGDVN